MSLIWVKVENRVSLDWNTSKEEERNKKKMLCEVTFGFDVLAFIGLAFQESDFKIERFSQEYLLH